MTQEEKQLLIKDLCARLPYGVIVQIQGRYDGEEYIRETEFDSPLFGYLYGDEKTIIPYLRPMSSITEEEYKELKSISPYYGFAPYEYIGDWCPNYDMVDWLNSHHFDYRGLIPMGLALEAPEGMYKDNQCRVKDVAEQCHRVLDGQFGEIVPNTDDEDAPFAIVTNTKTGKWFRAKKCSVTMMRHRDLSVDMTFSVTPDDIKDTIPVIGMFRLADGMTKKEVVGDNAEIHVEIFNKDKIKQNEYFLYNAWISSIDSETNEIVLTYDW